MSGITPTDRPRPLFLAPHYDDVALSCGGTVTALAAEGQAPLIITCFGGTPSGPLTSFAQFQHDRWGIGPADAIAIRREEEACAASALGATAHWFDFLDAIYRGDRYTSDEQLFGPLHPADRELIPAIVAAIAELAPPGTTLYVPLGVGNHVDHQLVTAAGQQLAARDYRVLAYEDFPYAGDPAAQDQVPARAAHVATGDPILRPLTTKELDARIRAILCYRSQLPVIFRHQGDPAAATRRYAEATGRGEPAERFWLLAPAAP